MSLFLLSLSFCGISNSSGDSAISTAHSQSEISSKESSPKEFRLSFVFHQAMATLEESRLNFRQSRSIFNDEDDEDSQKSYSSVNESLNLSQFSSGTSNFESGKHLTRKADIILTWDLHELKLSQYPEKIGTNINIF